MELPDELTEAEVELRQIYAEFRELKAEAQRKKDAEKSAHKNRGTDVIAEDSAEVVKKLKSSGLLEKLKIDDTPKTQFKRASTLERRLQTKPEPSSPLEDSSEGVRGFRAPVGQPVAPAFRGSRTVIPEKPPAQPARIDLTDRSAKPKNIFAAFLGGKPDSGSATGYTEPSRPAQAPSYSYNSDDRPTSLHRPPAFGYQANGYRQKMVLLEADNVDESFVRSVFEKFGTLLRLTPVPEKKQAFILFKIWEHSQNAIRELNGSTVDGVFLTVTVGDSRNEPKNRPSNNVPVIPPTVLVPETRQLMTYEEGELD